MKFEIVSKYADAGLNLPVRKTAGSAGYDFEVAADTIIPSAIGIINELAAYQCVTEYCDDEFLTLDQVAKLTKESGCKPTLVPTGVKCEIPDGYYLELSVRSSCPLKHWLILANGVGIIDADYYNNLDNEGHIFFQIINLSPFDILLRKGDAIGQGILKRYYLTNDDMATGIREGGFGSTDIVDILNLFGTPNTQEPDYIQLGIDLFNQQNTSISEDTPKEEEYVMACNPNRYPFFAGTRKDVPGIIDEAATFTVENYDVDYSST